MTEEPFVKGDPTAEQRRLIDVGIDLFRRLAPDAELGFWLLPADDAAMVYHGVRGGGSIYVAPDESVLFAASAVSPDVALEAFRGASAPRRRSSSVVRRMVPGQANDE